MNKEHRDYDKSIDNVKESTDELLNSIKERIKSSDEHLKETDIFYQEEKNVETKSNLLTRLLHFGESGTLWTYMSVTLELSSLLAIKTLEQEKTLTKIMEKLSDIPELKDELEKMKEDDKLLSGAINEIIEDISRKNRESKKQLEEMTKKDERYKNYVW